MLSHAGLVVLVDSFDSSAMSVYDETTMGGGSTVVSFGLPGNAPANTVLSRTVTHQLVQGTNTGGMRSNVAVAVGFPPGTLVIQNGSGRDAVVSIEWTLPAAFIPNALTQTSASVAFDLLLTDQSVVAELFYDNLLFGARTLTAYNGITGYAVPVPRATYFELTAAQQNAISSSDNQVLKLVLNGPTGWDLRLDNLRFELPEPGSLPLVCLALAGVVLALRRRRVAASRL